MLKIKIVLKKYILILRKIEKTDILDVKKLIFEKEEDFFMIDFDTAYFVLKVQELASRSKYGIFPFSKATSEQAMMGILYDDSSEYKERHPIVEGYFISAAEGNKLIANSDKDQSYQANDLKFNVYVPSDDDDSLKPWLEITSSKAPYVVIVDDGDISLA